MVTKLDPEIEKISKEAVERLRARIPIDAAYVFGSQVTGKTHEYSDIDLAAFSPKISEMRIDDKIGLIVGVQMEMRKIPIEIHLYDTSSLKEARPSNFIGVILETGMKIA
jgi:uncharacterized protein